VPGEPVLVFRDVWKLYPGGVAALAGASFSIPRGVLAGLVGPNGSGKTTSFRLAMGFARPSRGVVRVLGVDPWRREDVRSRLGYLPEKPVYPPRLQVGFLLEHMARLKTGDVGEARRLARLVGLEGLLSRPVGTLSRGYLQRLGLALAFMGSPELLLLDEPTANLDPSARMEILGLIRSLARETGATVVVSTHILPEMQRVANYIVALEGGRVAAAGPVASLAKSMGATLVYEVEAEAPREAAAELIRGSQVRAVEVAGPRLLRVYASPDVEELLAELARRGLVRDYRAVGGSIEELYRRIFGEPSGGEGVAAR